jgi:Hpt domain
MLRSVYPKGERGLEELSGTADDQFRTMFFEEARELLLSVSERLNELERRQNDRAHCDGTFREIHSLKGAASMVGLTAIIGVRPRYRGGRRANSSRLPCGRRAGDYDPARVERLPRDDG